MNLTIWDIRKFFSVSVQPTQRWIFLGESATEIVLNIFVAAKRSV